MITEANGAFCEICGFTLAERLGQLHHIVRHPDIPRAFEDMWRDLNTGLPWRGVVKNRRVNEISHASSEQQEAMTQLAQNVEQVATMTEQNVSVVNKTEAMVLKLEGIVDRMNKAVNQFSV